MIKCFWLRETNRLQRKMRRYQREVIFEGATRAVCNVSGIGYHNAEVLIEPLILSEETRSVIKEVTESEKRDLRWPKQCACGYVFTPNDHWQWFTERIYRRLDNGQDTTIRDAPPGAMWNAYWLTHRSDTPKPDGLRVMVKTPGGDWYVDDKASNGPGWTRTGMANVDPPTISATPSIMCHDYHGWLRNGTLVPA